MSNTFSSASRKSIICVFSFLLILLGLVQILISLTVENPAGAGVAGIGPGVLAGTGAGVSDTGVGVAGTGAGVAGTDAERTKTNTIVLAKGRTVVVDLVLNSSLGSYTFPRPPSSRLLPHTGTGSEHLYAEWIYNSTSGSFWLPHKPVNPIGGYELRSGRNDFQNSFYNNASGIVHEEFVNIQMFQSFNAGDFLAFFAAPMISGRAMRPHGGNTPVGPLAVVGSILGFGPRYSWGAGFISKDQKLSYKTQVIFAERGPVSYKQAISTNPDKTDPARQISKVYGDLGLLMSWFYQPHDQTKTYSLCLIPHYIDMRSPFVRLIRQQWKGSHVIDIEGPLFAIMDDIVKCEFILSSSLHGLIFSDSYGIPNCHMELSNKVFGGDHKFDDYFESVNRTRTTLRISKRNNGQMDATTTNTTGSIPYVQDWVRKSAASYNPSYINVLPFWKSCPIHAESYNRTREEHVAFAHLYAKSFSLLLEARASSLGGFIRDVDRALAQFPKRNVV
jgi:pyruvyltransferase